MLDFKVEILKNYLSLLLRKKIICDIIFYINYQIYYLKIRKENFMRRSKFQKAVAWTVSIMLIVTMVSSALVAIF